MKLEELKLKLDDIIGKENVIHEQDELKKYSQDLHFPLIEAKVPELIVIPKTLDEIQQIIQILLNSIKEQQKFIIKAPIIRDRKGEYKDLLQDLRKQGYVRVEVDGIQYTLDEEVEIVLGCGDGPRNPCLTASQAAGVLNEDAESVEIAVTRMIPENKVIVQDPQSTVADLSAKLSKGTIARGEREILRNAQKEISDPYNRRWWFGEARYCLRRDLREKIYEEGGLR